MVQIFLSYSSVDREWTQQFQARLQAALPSSDIFVDATRVKGVSWWETILDRIAAATLLLPILSPEFFQSIYCRAHYIEAQRIGVANFPLVLRKARLPIDFEHRHLFDLRGWDTATPLPDDLVTQLRAEHPLTQPRPSLTQPTPYPDDERPSDWRWKDLPAHGWGTSSNRQAGIITITNGSPPLPQMKSSGTQHIEPKTPNTFIIQGHDWLQVGCIAFFGVDDQAHMRSLSEKLTSLSFAPTEPYYSHMGEAVPEPENPYTDITHCHYSEINFTPIDHILFDRAFLIIYVATHTLEGDPAYAYINCRGDRIANLISKIDSGLPFDIQQYATLIEVGPGRPDVATRQRITRDYLFGETHLNVRIFPPLSDIT